MSKGNKHNGRKTRIKDYKKSKHFREAQQAKLEYHKKKKVPKL